jgi:2-methylaconitate isomerase
MATADELPVSVWRGGTSRGVFALAADLPAPGPERDRVVRGLLGSPDPFQIDGLGGTHAVTSKFVAVGPVDPADGSIAFQVAQVGVGDDVVDWSGTCGNLTAAVAPFALAAGAIDRDGESGVTTAALTNLSTEGSVRVRFAVRGGRYDSAGSTRLDGIAGTGSEIVTEYLEPAGGTLGALFPTGERLQRIVVHDGAAIEATVIDVAHPYLLLDAEAFGVDRATPFEDLHGDADLEERLEALRRRVSDDLGVPESQRSSVPRLVLCLPPTGDHDTLEVRAFAGGRFHPSIPVTAGLALAAAARLPGTLAHRLARPGSDRLTVRHPSGVLDVTATIEGDTVAAVGVVRTAREILRGIATPAMPSSDPITEGTPR